MTMDMPSVNKPSLREFELVKDDQGVVKKETGSPSLQTFDHMERSERVGDRGADFVLKSTLLAVGAGFAKGLSGGSLLWGLGMGIANGVFVAAVGVGGYAMAEGYLTGKSAYMPTNPAELRKDVFDVAKKQGVIPNQFRDPISYETIEYPVVFADDPTATIYDANQVETWREAALKEPQLAGRVTIRNPLKQDQLLDFENLVYLPKVKEQIDELKTMGIIEDEDLQTSDDMDVEDKPQGLR